MKKALVKTWCEALRSGKYYQGKGSLKVKDEFGYGHCCLGVLSEIVSNLPEVQKTEWVWNSYTGEWTDNKGKGSPAKALLPIEVSQALELSERVQIILAGQNDNGILFDEIATNIEKELCNK